jgi:serine/threonine-protein kinase
VLEPKSLVAGRYEIVRVIGAGGMGSVYEAIHTVSKRSIALKILAPELCRNEATRERFLREASAPAQIGHPGIVEVFDAGFDPQTGALFVAMELLKGETLRERLERLAAAPTPEAREQALLLFGALLEPLAAAHSKNIVHRDIKPENIFLQRNALGIESVKVLDFGIARDVESDKPSVTRTGIAMGTPHYMAPEQAMSAREEASLRMSGRSV